MENKSVIWDLDGTLFDSYKIYVPILQESVKEKGVFIEENEIFEEIITYTIGHFWRSVQQKYGISIEYLSERYYELVNERNSQIKPMQNAEKLLENLQNLGVKQFVYTHKDKSANDVLDRMNIAKYFTEVVTSENGFARKPSAEAVEYLLEKYNLEKDNTFYIGDRQIDIDCGKNAQIKTILFLQENGFAKISGNEDFVVKDLLEISDILKKFKRIGEFQNENKRCNF